MSSPDYIFTFQEIGSKPSSVSFLSRKGQSKKHLNVQVNDDQLLYRRRSNMEPRLSDLIDLGVAIYIADRHVSPRRDHHSDHIRIVLPVRCPEVFGSEAIERLLIESLNYFTGNNWSFTFVERSFSPRASEHQMVFGDIDRPIEVALWSGGLDSLAGLYNRIVENPTKEFTLLSTSSNRLILGAQKKTIAAMQNRFMKTSIKFEQIPFFPGYGDETPKNKAPRSRGFLFLLMGAVSAYLEGQNVLHVYENGIGAINLPFRRSSTGLDHSHAVHPISLCRMSELMSLILETQFRYDNPFLFSTKAQICAPLIERNDLDLIHITISCDRRRRGTSIQCGACSSCLLRREALAIYNIEDQAYAVPHNTAHLRANQPKPGDGDFLRAMYNQIITLNKCFSSDNIWARLANEYPELPQITWWLSDFGLAPIDILEQKLINLYKVYTSEWLDNDVLTALSSGLINDNELNVLKHLILQTKESV